MSKPRTANDHTPLPHWKVRIAMRGGHAIHVLSATKPGVRTIIEGEAVIIDNVMMEPIENTEHGDTLGFIDWREVAAVSWRFAPPKISK